MPESFETLLANSQKRSETAGSPQSFEALLSNSMARSQPQQSATQGTGGFTAPDPPSGIQEATPAPTAPDLTFTQQAQNIGQAARSIADTAIDAAPAVEGIRSLVTDAFTGKSKETEQTRKFPELSLEIGGDVMKEIPTLAGRVKTSIQNLVSTDPQDMITTLQSVVPGLDDFEDSKGNKFVTFPSGKTFQVNKAGFSKADVEPLVAETLAHAVGGQGVAKLGLKGLMGRIASAFGVELGQESVSKGVGAKGEFDTSEALLAGGIEAGLGIAKQVPGLAKFAKDKGGEIVKRQLRRVSDVALGSKEAAGLFQPKTPVLSKAVQATRDKVIARSNDAAVKFFDGLETGKFSKAKSVQDLQKVTKSIIEGKFNARKTEGGKLFKGAFKAANDAKVKVPVDDLIKQIDADILKAGAGSKGTKILEQQIKNAKGPEKKKLKKLLSFKTDQVKAFEKMKTMIQQASKNLDSGSNAEALALVKQNLFFEVDKLARKGSRGLANQTKAKVQNYWSLLRNNLIKSVPGYEKSLDEFIKRSGDIEKATAIFQGLHELEGGKAAKISKNLFNSNITPVENLRQIKSVLKKSGTSAWEGLQQSHIVNEAEQLGNVPNEQFASKLFDRLFSKAGESNPFVKTLNPDQRNNVNKIRKLVRALPDGRSSSGSTVLNEAYDKQIKELGLDSLDPEVKNQIKSQLTIKILNDSGLVSKLAKLPTKTDSRVFGQVRDQMKNLITEAMVEVDNLRLVQGLDNITEGE